MTHRSRTIFRRGHRRGAVMTEMVLVLPVILVLLGMLFYFGRGFVRMQHAAGMGRYEAWRHAERAPRPRASITGDNRHMNQMFFSGNAQTIDLRRTGFFPREAPDALIRASGVISSDGGDYAEELLARLPRGSTVEFTTSHRENHGLWERFAGPIHHRHTRLDNDWRFVNGMRQRRDPATSETQWIPARAHVSNIPVLRDMFFTDLDQRLQSEAGQGVRLAETLRSFYLHQPGYAGPEVPTQWHRSPR